MKTALEQTNTIRKIIFRANTLTPNEKKINEDDTPIIKAIKKGLKPLIVDKETQTELTMAQIKEMENQIKGINEKLTSKKIIDTDTRGGKDLLFRLKIIEREIATLEENKENERVNGNRLREKMKGLE